MNKLQSIQFREGDVLVDESTGEIIKIVEIYIDYHTRKKDYRCEIIKSGTENHWGYRTESFWLNQSDLHWVYKKLDKSHPAYVLFGTKDE